MKNKIFSFVLDLFKDGDKEEQAGIFAQVKIYRSTSARVFEIIVGILVLTMWLLTIRNVIHATSDDLPYLLLLAGMGTFFPIACLLHSYHPKANDFPFVKIVNARQVYYLSLLDRYAALWSALFWLWISCMDFIGSEPVFVGGVIVCCVLLCLNGVFFFYKIYQLRNLVEVENPEPAIKNEKLLTIGVLVLTAVLGFAMHLLPIWDCMPKILSGILRSISGSLSIGGSSSGGGGAVSSWAVCSDLDTRLRQVRACHVDAGALLVEVVYRGVELVAEEVEVHAHIVLLRHLPRHIDVGHARVCEAVVVVGVHAHVAELVASECTHGVEP